jgi:hypothetical protein
LSEVRLNTEVIGRMPPIPPGQRQEALNYSDFFSTDAFLMFHFIQFLRKKIHRRSPPARRGTAVLARQGPESLPATPGGGRRQ